MKRILITILFCFISMSFNHYEVQPPKQEYVEVVDTSFLQAKELNDSILYLALLHYEVKHPRAVLAQAKLESGNYTSSHCRNRNNFLGLYNSRRREYFKFNHWSECILAYKDMIEYKLREGEDYYQFLDRIGYASSSNYIDLVKEIEKQIQFNDKGLVTSKNKCV